MGRRKREERWAALEAQMKGMLEEAKRRFLLAADFDEMEEIAVEQGAAFEQALMVAGAELREPGIRALKCPRCGEAMKRHDRVGRQLKTSGGKVNLKRERWVCPGCGETLFPPG